MPTLEQRKAAAEKHHREALAKIEAEETRRKRVAELDEKLDALRAERDAVTAKMRPLLEEREGLVRHRKDKVAP